MNDGHQALTGLGSSRDFVNENAVATTNLGNGLIVSEEAANLARPDVSHNEVSRVDAEQLAKSGFQLGHWGQLQDSHLAKQQRLRSATREKATR